MKIAVFSTKPYEKEFLEKANDQTHQLTYFSKSLSLEYVRDAKGFDGVCCFVSDCLNEPVIKKLSENGIRFITLRSAGYDHVDMNAVKKYNMIVMRVPRYSPEAIAEFALGLILALNRKIITAYQQGLDYNFSLNGLMGFNLQKKTIGIVGTGHIGTAFAKILQGFSCRLLAFDVAQNDVCKKLNVQYVSLQELLNQSDIVSLHCPLNDETRYLINKNTISQMKPGAMLINTARGGVVETQALIDALQSHQLSAAGLDVYEHEKNIFFIDHRGTDIKKDNLLSILQSIPNVIVTPHQAFLTEEAMCMIAKTTIENMTGYETGKILNQIL